jgi:Flp pilus assembly CpaF family ATPase
MSADRPSYVGRSADMSTDCRDPEVSEIMVNGHDQLYVQRSGRLYTVEAGFTDEAHLRRTTVRACVHERLNIVISGGTGSGKTTTLNMLSSFVPADERTITTGSFRGACERLGIAQSIGQPGSALDNAVIEPWHSTW